MNTRNLLVTLTVAALATVNVLAADALLSPRGMDLKRSSVVGYNADPNLTATGPSSVTPRVLGNQPKFVAGKSTTETPSLKCVRQMSGSPKMIGACTESATGAMSCCGGADKK